MHALGVGDEVTRAFVAFAGVEHRIDAVAARRAHHRADVFWRLRVEQADAAVSFVCHVPGPFAKKARLYGLPGSSGGRIDGQSFFNMPASPANGLWVALAMLGVLVEPSLKYCWSV